MIDQAKRQGVSQQCVCMVAGLSMRRVERWRERTGALEDHRPGPKQAPHRLLTQEKQAILERAQKEAYADASSRILAYGALDEGSAGTGLQLAVSPSSVYRTLAQAGLSGERGKARLRRAGGSRPEREDLTGPNQRWCWDISYLRTPVKYSYLYLYLLLDEWSRKEVAWLVATMESYELGKVLMDRALEKEGLLYPDAPRPVIVNDRGPSMKAKSFKQFLADLGVVQIFARPRTPNDNPFVEAAFRTVKYHPQYPAFFERVEQAQEYFHRFFEWYNHQHLHSGIGYVPPALKHAREDQVILERRRERLDEARSRRLEVNRASNLLVTGAPSLYGL